MIHPRLRRSSFASLILLVLVACGSTTSPADSGADAGGTCIDGVQCTSVPLASDGTCSGTKGMCGCTAQGVLSCAPGFIVSSCGCNTSCTTEGSYCTNCGDPYRTCKCLAGSWTTTHGVGCVSDAGSD